MRESQYKGSVADIVVKNEYMAVWKDGKIKAVFPTWFASCILTAVKGNEYRYEARLEITMVGVKCHQRARETMETAVGKKHWEGIGTAVRTLSIYPLKV